MWILVPYLGEKTSAGFMVNDLCIRDRYLPRLSDIASRIRCPPESDGLSALGHPKIRGPDLQHRILIESYFHLQLSMDTCTPYLQVCVQVKYRFPCLRRNSLGLHVNVYNEIDSAQR